MLSLIVGISHLSERNNRNLPASQPNWRQKLWHKFVDWLVEPIPFPGKWDINLRPSQSYNKEERQTSEPPEVPEVIDGR
jgi:hypothetical protein